jgi:nicotinamide-nucleotide adenylyltransferase
LVHFGESGSGGVIDAEKVYSVHGRFQPFHNGHLNYVRTALESCELLFVGITQVERSSMKTFDSAPHRSEVQANPLSYFERKYLIERALVSEGIPQNRFSVIPFPIEKDDILGEYFPKGGVCFTTIHSEWNRTKIELLTNLGYEVRVLDNPDKWELKRESATVIRQLIRANNPGWKCFVPVTIATIIEQEFMRRFA